MTVGEVLEQLKDLPPDTLLCVAEIDEAFAVNVASVEIVEDAKAQSRQASGREAVELGHGDDQVVVIRW
ncbi:sugar phosphorylase [Chelativorans sp. YIM 93263]|uniref:sugar phosphorylase n=1 Tax=Chelativorans sp. YIM 93263 TaxID=2906648 RepID=UPI002379C354|nr:sugar phosphorylase [Chelativorans sp. YIM 93263]